jgi:hypothetical protein
MVGYAGKHVDVCLQRKKRKRGKEDKYRVLVLDLRNGE